MSCFFTNLQSGRIQDTPLLPQQQLGITHSPYYWIHSGYFSDRKQATKFLGEKSIYLSIKFGVPQGSLLGPLLFSIYINDMVNACNLSNPYLFADDGALLFENICRKTYLSIKIEMLTIIKWLSANKLSLNVDKTELLIFDNANFSVKIKLNNNYAIKGGGGGVGGSALIFVRTQF